MNSYKIGLRIDAAQAATAFLHSFTAVTLSVFAIGAVYFPFDLWRMKQRKHITVLDCQSVASDQAAISLVRSQSGQPEAALDATLAVHDFSKEAPTDLMRWRGASPSCISVSHDRRQLFVGSSDGCLYIVDVSQPNEEPWFLGKHNDAASEAIASAPDDSLVVSIGFQSFYAWNVQRRSLAWERSDLDASCFAVCSNETLVCGNCAGEILELNLLTGKTVRVLFRHRSPIRHLAVSRNATLIAVDGGGQALLFRRLRDAGNWRQQAAGKMFSGSNRMWFSPDGQRVIGTSCNNLALLCWSISELKPICEMSGHTAPIIGAGFRSDGSLMSWGTDGTIRVWNLVPATPSPLATVVLPQAAG